MRAMGDGTEKEAGAAGKSRTDGGPASGALCERATLKSCEEAVSTVEWRRLRETLFLALRSTTSLDSGSAMRVLQNDVGISSSRPSPENNVGICARNRGISSCAPSNAALDSPSWYSSAETHIFLNVLSPARILPPIQVEYLRSGGALIRIFVSRNASFLTSCNNRSPNPVREHQLRSALVRKSENVPLTNVPPPLSTTFPKRLFRRSRSERLIESTTTWCTPAYSSPTSSGVKRSSGARWRSAPSCMRGISPHSSTKSGRATNVDDVPVWELEVLSSSSRVLLLLRR